MPHNPVETILVEDSRLIALCWRLESASGRPLRIFTTPMELIDQLVLSELHPDSVFVLDIDFAGLDTLSGVELATKLRGLGIQNRIYLYSGFSETVPSEMLDSGIVDGIHSKDLSPREVIAKLSIAS